MLDACRWLYNQLVKERKNKWDKRKQRVTCYDQIKTIPKLTAKHPRLELVYSQTRQNVAIRVDLAFKAFFRRCKSGEKPGYPRFKGELRYDSITYPQANNSFRLTENNTRIRLSKIGNVKIVYHQKLQGTIKTCTIKRSSADKWYVTIVCDGVRDTKCKKVRTQVGIDVGLTTFATLSDGLKIPNPKFFMQGERAVAKSQRKSSQYWKKTRAKTIARHTLAVIHEKIANRRIAFIHNQSRFIVDNYATIVVENLGIKNMLINSLYPTIRKGIYDVAWRTFLTQLAYKAANAGRQFIAVNPAYTTQDCSKCGNRQVMKLSDRTYCCPVCGLTIDRDLNAARNILAVGLHSLATQKVA